MLAEALCKLEGFAYAPSDAVYWQHGRSTERDFIYVTTANLNHEQLQQLNDEVGSDRSLLVLCTAFRGRSDYPNITVKKIPKQVLTRCEWGHDDYSLQVENLPKAPLSLTPVSLTPGPSPGGRGEKRNPGQQDLDLA
jgi:adenine-specific DNA-methyltransferase